MKIVTEGKLPEIPEANADFSVSDVALAVGAEGLEDCSLVHAAKKVSLVSANTPGTKGTIFSYSKSKSALVEIPIVRIFSIKNTSLK